MAILDMTELNIFHMTNEQFYNYCTYCKFRSNFFSNKESYNIDKKKLRIVEQELLEAGKDIPWKI